MEDKFLAYLELRQDFLFEKIPEHKYNYYISKSLEWGKQKAEELENREILDIINEQKINLEMIKGDGEFFKVKLRAQFEFDPKGNHKIIVYESSIKKYAETSEISEKTALDIHILHELFHYFESLNGDTISQQLEPIKYSTLGIKRKSYINRCSEIAAHAFVKEYLSMDNLPNYYDYKYLINTNKLSQEKLLEWEEEFNRLS